MTPSDRPVRRWSAFPPSRSLCIAALAAAVAVPVCAALVVAQGQRRSAPPLQPFQLAARAFIEGRYDDVETLTDKLDARDPNVVALKARAAIARGRYAQAESALKPAAMRAPTSAAALELGLLEQMLGRAEATAMLEKIAEVADTTQDMAELARAARALRALGRFQEANAAYRDAVGAARGDAAVNTAWGDLFLEKYNKAEALKSYQLALQSDPKFTPALLGSARALADDNPPQAVTMAKQALEVNPSYVDAQIFLASQAVDAGNRDDARDLLQKALAVNPSSLDAHAWLAALAFVEDKDQEFQAEAAKALAIAPNYGEVYRAAGDLAARNYRFDEAVELTRRALTLAPQNPRALADLGMHLLRTGDETGAREVLDAAFKLDPFDVITFNLLGLLDTLEKFDTVRDGDLVVRMNREEAPVLKDFAVSLSHQALTTMAERYEFTPRGPILIEIFPKHDDFAVRNLGLPGMIGALGVCFGRVVSMDSPRARPPGEFQWEATLWHELGHVITLQMSNQRVPRWLTEGISVFEEKRARPEWGREMDVSFAGMLERGETLKLKDLNAGFTNPHTISLAYFEASLAVDHLVQTFGQPGLNKLLRAFGTGLDSEAALKQALNTDFDQLQVGFDQYVERAFGELRRAMAMPKESDNLLRMPLEALRTVASANPKSYPVQLALGTVARRAGQADEAIEAFERAAALVPVAGGKDSAHAQMAAIALEKNDRRRAIAEFEALVAVDFNNVEAARKLASLLQEEGTADPAKLRPVYQRIAAIDPFDADAHARLGRMAMARNEPESAVREFRAVIALGPVDQAGAHTDLAESYFRSGKRDEAKKQTLAALEIAPTYERAQDLLLKLSGGQQP